MSKRPAEYENSQQETKNASKDEDAISVVIDKIVEELEEIDALEDWMTVEKFQLLKSLLEEFKQEVDFVNEIKKDDENAMVQKDYSSYRVGEIISFSRVTKEILKTRLGMKETVVVEAGRGLENIAPQIIQELRRDGGGRYLDQIESVVAKWDLDPLMSSLATIEDVVNAQSEASARIIINTFIIEHKILIERVVPGSSAIPFPELLMSSKKSADDIPPKVVYNDKSTYLTGGVDYLFSILEDGTKLKNPEAVRNLVAELERADNPLRALHLIGLCNTCTMHEAEDRAKTLSENEPQVIAQGVAVVEKLRSMGGANAGLDGISFTLTSGTNWIFGTVDVAAKQCVRTTELGVSLDNEESSVQPAAANNRSLGKL
ncbi:hypothetical protein H0H93_008146 [Arthromyces matolae]|nr:hypothetical protein H0H93_008146 [Arthromyces matolae]